MLTLKLFLNYFSFLALLIPGNPATSLNENVITTKIGLIGSQVLLRCISANSNLCSGHSLYWTYKLPNGEDEDFTDGTSPIRKEMYPLNEMQYNLSTDQSCAYDLLLEEIRFSAAGLFICWDGSTELTKTNLIVIDDTKNCTTSAEVFSSHDVIIDENNRPFTINCTVEYSTDDSCVASPIWKDITHNRILTSSENGFKITMENRLASLSWKPNIENEINIRNGTQFNLSISFNCSSFSNNSQDVRQQGVYDFGTVPFTFYFKSREEIFETAPTTLTIYEETVTSESKRKEAPTTLTVAFTTGGTLLAAFVVTLVILIVCLKKRISASHGLMRSTELSVLGKQLPEVPPEDYIGIKNDFQSKYAQNYEVLEDGTYDVINDRPESAYREHYIQVLE